MHEKNCCGDQIKCTTKFIFNLLMTREGSSLKFFLPLSGLLRRWPNPILCLCTVTIPWFIPTCTSSPLNFRSMYPAADWTCWVSPQSCFPPRLGHLSEWKKKVGWYPSPLFISQHTFDQSTNSVILPSKYILRVFLTTTTTVRCCSSFPLFLLFFS